MYLVTCGLMDALELSIYLSLHFHRAGAADSEASKEGRRACTRSCDLVIDILTGFVCLVKAGIYEELQELKRVTNACILSPE